MNNKASVALAITTLACGSIGAAVAAEKSITLPPDGVSLDPGKAGHLLVVPHRDAPGRLFVLAPLSDLAPGLVPPGWHRTVETARRDRFAEEGPATVRAVAQWAGGTWVGASPPRS